MKSTLLGRLTCSIVYGGKHVHTEDKYSGERYCKYCCKDLSNLSELAFFERKEEVIRSFRKIHQMDCSVETVHKEFKESMEKKMDKITESNPGFTCSAEKWIELADLYEAAIFKSMRLAAEIAAKDARGEKLTNDDVSAFNAIQQECDRLNAEICANATPEQAKKLRVTAYTPLPYPNKPN